MTNLQPDKPLPKPKVLEFESLELSDNSRIVHVRQCQLSFDRGLWLHHAETDRWLHWSGYLGYWVPTLDGPSYWWDDRPWEADDLTSDETQERFPGSVPVVAKVDKRMEAKRRKIRREEVIANTDVQTFDKPMKMPRGFDFIDEGSKRTFRHRTNPTAHATGRVYFVEGPAYVAIYWPPGVDPNTRISRDSRRFLDKNEAQGWAIDGMRSAEKIQRAVVKNEAKSEETK